MRSHSKDVQDFDETKIIIELVDISIENQSKARNSVDFYLEVTFFWSWNLVKDLM